jgi:outer membrane protein assembly factor BamB
MIWSEAQGNWPHWRGPNENGVVDQGNPPLEWSESKNIVWKTKIPGQGHATPIVWGDQIFVQTALSMGEGAGFQYKVIALNRKNGKVVWEKTVQEATPHQGKHQTASFASTSGITDGERLYAFFGSRGLYCLDMDGNLKWEKDFGQMQIKNSFGEGTSPVVFGNKLIVNWDHEGDSFIVALDKKTGKEIWRTPRSERTSWSTPLVIEHKGRHQVVIGATSKTRSYDLETGELIWECSGLGSNVIPMAVHANGIVYVTSGHRMPAMQAIVLNKAIGDITDTDAVLWSISQDTPYVSSPLLSGDRLYFLKNRNAILSCYDARTGQAHFGPLRLEGMRGVYASLVGVHDRVYISGLEGTTLVIKDSSEFEILASNTIEEGIAASPVIVGDELFLRGEEHLYCIGEKNE